MSFPEFSRNSGLYVRHLEGNATTTQLLFLDTNRDAMTSDQVQWLQGELDSTAAATTPDEILASLVFMHIPPKEFVEQMCSRESICVGMYGEKAEYGGKDLNTGFYEVFRTLQGSVRAIFSGHDHKNDLCSVSFPSRRQYGMRPTEVLCYARASGYGGYGHDTLLKGARIIHMNEKTKSIFSYVIDETGERRPLLHFTEKT